MLIVESLDRLSRDNVVNAFSQFTGILTKGITIVTLMDNQVYTKESVNENVGQLFLSMGIMIRANDESRTKSKRLKAAWERRRATISEKKLTSVAPAWLKLSEDRTTFHVIEKKAKIVADIFDMCNSGMGVYSIVRELNRDLKKYPTLTGSKNWYETYIQTLLTNRAVLGEFQPRDKTDGVRSNVGKPVPDYYPRIISDETFSIAQVKIRDRKLGEAGRKGDTLSNLFTGLVTCSSCGGKLTMKGGKTKGETYKYLRCVNSMQGSGCDAPYWTYDEFEKTFINFVKSVSLTQLVDGGKNEGLLSVVEDTIRAALEFIEEDNKRYEGVIDLMEDNIGNAKMLATLKARAAAIEDELKKAEFKVQQFTLYRDEILSLDVGADHKNFIKLAEEIGKIKDAKKLKDARFQMSKIIKRHFHSIAVHNNQTLDPQDAPAVVQTSVLELLATRGHNTPEKIVEYFSKLRGQRLFANSERYMIVNTGRVASITTRVVHAATGSIHLNADELSKALIRGMK